MDSSPKNYEENCCQSEEKTRLRKGNKMLQTIVALKRGTRLVWLIFSPTKNRSVFDQQSIKEKNLKRFLFSLISFVGCAVRDGKVERVCDSFSVEYRGEKLRKTLRK
jgi:hypothetical protein